jgi:hypothetical protein
VLAAAAVVAVSVVAAGRLGAHPPRCQNTFVPAFFNAGSDWSQAIGSSPPPSHIILDVTSSGAGTAPDPALVADVKQAQAAGITVLGYADTNYGGRPAAQVEADVQHYRQWYHVTGIFLDQAATGAAQLGYYRDLSTFIRRDDPGAQVWLNPGDYPDPGYLSVANVVMAFEGSYASYLHTSVPGWVSHYAAARFAHTIYAAPGSQLASAVRLSRSKHAAFVYVTDRSGANPYSGLPSYWQTEDSDVTSSCAAG